MSKKLFKKIYSQKKKKINISIDADLKAELVEQKAIDGISVSERIEDLYRSHPKAIEDISISSEAFPRSRGERGQPMYGDTVRQVCGISLTPDAIAFFDAIAKKKGIDRSKIIELAIRKLF